MQNEVERPQFLVSFVFGCVPHIRAHLKHDDATPRKNLYWVGGGDNEGLSYCDDCIDGAVAAAKAKNPDIAEEIGRDGGWPIVADGPAFCETCGCALDAILTESGAADELLHFAERLAEISALDELSRDERRKFDDALDVAQHWGDGSGYFELLAECVRLSMPLLPDEPASMPGEST